MAPNVLSAPKDKAEDLDIYNSSDFKKSKTDFTWMPELEPHAQRKRKILLAHPEIKELYGTEPLTGLLTVILVATQFWISTWLPDCPWYVYLPVAFGIGGTINHSLFLANHELSHNLGFKSIWLNQLFGMVTNWSAVVPSASAFRLYHFEHHALQGVDGIDADIPTQAEMDFIGDSRLLKFLFVFFQIAFYAVRPTFVKPLKFNFWVTLNFSIQMVVNFLTVKYIGWQAIIYFLASDLLGGGIHPCAGHFIAEHYEFVDGYETYSYIGPCNYFNFNVGYHIEHHDFTRIPWTRIWKVREIAPEWYNYPVHNSYTKVIWNYIFDPEMGPWSRIKRKNPKNKKLA